MNLFEQYGIKEVADVIVYELNADGSFGAPVLFFDTLKVSNIEQTGETANARGGKGNPKLIEWSYNKEIMITLQDALLSPKSLEFMTGANGTAHAGTKNIRKAEVLTLGSTKKFSTKYAAAGSSVYIIDTQETLTTTNGIYTSTAGASGQIVRVGYNVVSVSNSVYEVVIKPDSFPGTYAIVGDTFIRNKTTGVDEGFQFIVPKAKLGTDVTFTMEAEGDPTVFDMSVTVLKANNGSMMSLVKYDIGDASEANLISNL